MAQAQVWADHCEAAALALGAGHRPAAQLARCARSDARDGEKDDCQSFQAVGLPSAMKAAKASHPARGIVRPNLERRHRISSGKRAHSLVMR